MSPDAARRTATRGLAAVLRVPGQPDLRLPALLRYAACDPYAVRMVLLLDSCPDSCPGSDGTGGGGRGADSDAPESVEWLFARALLTAGLTGPSGEGDVRVRVVEREVHVELAGAASVLLPLDGLVEFLADAYTVVPTGSEEQAVARVIEAELSRLFD